MPRHGTATERVAKVIEQAIGRHRDELASGPLMLAVSGGADSLAMLLAASSLPEAKRPKLAAAHFSHGLRPDADPEEEALVRRVAGSLNVPLVHGKAMVAPTEASAREARYAFLAEAMQAHSASAVATAHTLDDQAETLLLRLTRGTGTRGAGSIRELSMRTIDGTRVVLLRPLLHVPRMDTEAVCREAGIVPAMDMSNRSVRYARNRVRLRVLPELAHINPRVREALAHYAGTAQEDNDLLESLAAAAVKDTEAWDSHGAIWPRSTLAGLPGPLLARVIQTAWRRLRGEGAALSSAKLEAIGQLIAQPEGGESSLDEGFVFSVEQELCRMGTLSFAPMPFQTVLPVPGDLRWGRWQIQAGIAEAPHDIAGTSAWEALLDADRAGTPLYVRGRRVGDRFQPLGLPQAAKLQDVLVNAKVPRTERASWPLVTGTEGIVWVPGVRIAEWAKVTEHTKNVLVLRARRME